MNTSIITMSIIKQDDLFELFQIGDGESGFGLFS